MDNTLKLDRSNVHKAYANLQSRFDILTRLKSELIRSLEMYNKTGPRKRERDYTKLSDTVDEFLVHGMALTQEWCGRELPDAEDISCVFGFFMVTSMMIMYQNMILDACKHVQKDYAFPDEKMREISDLLAVTMVVSGIGNDSVTSAFRSGQGDVISVIKRIVGEMGGEMKFGSF